MRIALLFAVTSWAIACSTQETRSPSHLMTHDAAGDAHTLANLDGTQAMTAADGAVPRPDKFRAVFIADTHIIGPQYTCCSESEGADNASIVRTVERLESTQAKINGMRPRPDMVFVLGDVLHDAHHEQVSIGMWKTTPPFLSQQMSLKDLKCPCILFLAIMTTR